MPNPMRKKGKLGHTLRPGVVKFAGGCCERCGHDDIERLKFYRFEEALECEGCVLHGPLREIVVIDITEIRSSMPVLVMLCYKCANHWLRATRLRDASDENQEGRFFVTNTERDKQEQLSEAETQHDFDNWMI